MRVERPSNMATLYHADCFDVMPDLGAQSVDMVCTDPPYGSTECAWDTTLPLETLWEQYRRLVRPDGAIVITAAQPFTSALIVSNLPAFAHTWTWNKGVAANFVQAKRQPLKVTEDVCVFCLNGKQPRYFPIMTERDKPQKMGGTTVNREAIPLRGQQWRDGALKNKVYTEAYPSTILTFSPRAAGQRGLHPTQKPVGLMDYLIRTYTQPGDLVLDPCMGSGTAGVAALAAGRCFVGVERDQKHFETALRRIREAIEAPARAAAGGMPDLFS
jgi:site-specific DNA-methyltransferase (adenine-specific)